MKRFYLIVMLLPILAGIKAADKDYTVPEDVSVANVFAALYKNARVLGMGIHAPNSGREPSSGINAMQMFSAYCTNGYCDYVRGKCMKVDLSQLPKIDLRSYNREYGEGAGQKAIEKYTKSPDRVDSKDEHKELLDSCAFFEREHLEAVPYGDHYDMQEKINMCYNMKTAVQGLSKFIKNSAKEVFEDCQDCRVDYVVESPPFSRFPIYDNSLQEATSHLSRLNNHRHRDTVISRLKVRCADQDLPPEKTSEVSLGDGLSIAAAKDALDKISKINEKK